MRGIERRGNQWIANGAPDAEAVAEILRSSAPWSVEAAALVAIVDQLGSPEHKWDSGHLARVARKVGIPLPRGVDALRTIEIDAWIRAMLATTHAEILPAAPHQAAPVATDGTWPAEDGLGMRGPRPAAPGAVQLQPTGEPSDQDVIDGFRVRFAGEGFPNVWSERARAAIDVWRTRNGRPFPLPDPASSSAELAPSIPDHPPQVGDQAAGQVSPDRPADQAPRLTYAAIVAWLATHPAARRKLAAELAAEPKPKRKPRR